VAWKWQVCSYRQLGIAATTSQDLEAALDIWSDDRNVARELTNSNEEIAEEDKQAV
jgi:hypothetical protein